LLPLDNLRVCARVSREQTRRRVNAVAIMMIDDAWQTPMVELDPRAHIRLWRPRRVSPPLRLQQQQRGGYNAGARERQGEAHGRSRDHARLQFPGVSVQGGAALLMNARTRKRSPITRGIGRQRLSDIGTIAPNNPPKSRVCVACRATTMWLWVRVVYVLH
jgi:hypothetical protein